MSEDVKPPECRCGEPDCAWLAAWDHAEQLLADELREQRGREAFGYRGQE